MDLLLKYFPHLTQGQILKYKMLDALYKTWNLKINVVSRKDIETLLLKHVLHSLGIAKVIAFKPHTRVIDVGTGGGFPGIPLSIMFPQTQFYLVDSISKKIKVVDNIVQELELDNVKTLNCRIEKVTGHYDFIVSRAVTKMPVFVNWTRKLIAKNSRHSLKNGILYLKGGNLEDELQSFPEAEVYRLSNHFSEAFFDTKKVVYLPL